MLYIEGFFCMVRLLVVRTCQWKYNSYLLLRWLSHVTEQRLNNQLACYDSSFRNLALPSLSLEVVSCSDKTSVKVTKVAIDTSDYAGQEAWVS